MIRLSDVFEPTVYGSYTAVDNPMTSAFIRAGIMRSTPVMNGIARAGGRTAVVPFWRDIDPSIEPNYSNDDPADLAVPHKIGFGTMTARKSWLNQGFGEMDLVSELAGESPLQHVRNRFGTYWVRQQNRRLIATCVGVMARNVAANGGDMVVDISGQVGANGVFGANAFIDAAYTAGENAETFTGIAVHSMIMARMVKSDEVEVASEGGVTISRYKGRVIIMDDTLPVEGVGDARVYTSILFGSGAIGFGGVEGSAFALGEGIPKLAAEVSRTAEAGNGGGMESIWERKTWIIHPHGFEWVEGGAAMAELSPTLADLRLAAHWNRVVDRRQVPLAFIKSRAV
jgi:hypothetical protein